MHESPGLQRMAQMDPLRHPSRVPLACGKCTRRYPASAKFCANCGAKLPRREKIVQRTRLPALDTARPSTVASPLEASPEIPPHNGRAAPPLRQKRPRPPAKNPARIAKLETDSPLVPAVPRSRDAEPIDDHEHKLKIWMASTRRLLESVLELKRRLDRPESEEIDPVRFQSIDHILTALQHDLDKLEPCFVLDRNLQAKCVAMLTKLSDLYHATLQQLPKAPTDTESSPQRQQCATATSPGTIHLSAIADAEVVIQGPDGKRIFFRARKTAPKRIASDSSDDNEDDEGTFVHQAHHQRRVPAVDRSLRPTNGAVSDEDCDSSTVRPCMAQFMRERWPDLLVFRVARVDGSAVFLRLRESDELRQLVIEMYRPLTSTSITVGVPLEWLAFVLPPTVTWYRVCEVRRYKAVEAHWSRCLEYVLRCLKWTVRLPSAMVRLVHDVDVYRIWTQPPGHAIDLQFPIHFRQARRFTFRSFAAFYGLLSVRVLTPDYALKITFLNARTHERVTLTLPETTIVRCLTGSDPYRERIVGTATRQTLCVQVCDKLYFAYTSRGFELLFPGMKPKGVVRRHPQEICVAQHRVEQLELERTTLQAVLNQCIHQTVVIARRRMESYADRVRRAKKEKQETAAKKIQARTRSLVAKRKSRREREELRRTSRLYELAAVLIQREFRRRQEASRQRRELQRIQRDTRGVRFRRCCRVNGTFVLALVALDEVDAAANAFDCVLCVVHPSTAQTAQLRIAYCDVLRLFQTTSLAGRPRSEIVRSLVSDHVDVFRSARHAVLAIALRCSGTAV